MSGPLYLFLLYCKPTQLLFLLLKSGPCCRDIGGVCERVTSLQKKPSIVRNASTTLGIRTSPLRVSRFRQLLESSIQRQRLHVRRTHRASSKQIRHPKTKSLCCIRGPRSLQHFMPPRNMPTLSIALGCFCCPTKG